jgi:lactate racemase
VHLPYGRQPLHVALDAETRQRTTFVQAPDLPAPAAIKTLLAKALAAPNVIGSSALEQAAAGAKRVTIVVSDATRTEPRAAMLDALLQRLPADTAITLAIATGTHGPTAIAELGLDSWLANHRIAALVNHDGHQNSDLVDVGQTEAGTNVRLHRCVVDTDLVIATGMIRPHYFAGFGAGVKAIFPGLGSNPDIRHNHLLKLHPRARAGIVDDNPCRMDLEEAVRRLPTPTFLLNGITAADHQIHDFVAGDLWQAFRAGADRCRTWCKVLIERPAPLVIASDVLPITGSLYQACKIAAAVAHLVEANGRLVLVAECPEGTGPIDVVNRAIYQTGIAPRLAPGVTIELVSGLSDEVVATTFAKPRAKVEDCLRAERILVLARASSLIVDIKQ